MSNGPFSTIGYRGHWIHCDANKCKIQTPDLSQVKGTSSSLEAAKKRIRKLMKARR